MIGKQILSYKVLSLIGEGGMGDVYLAEHVQLKGRKVAIKSLHSRLVRNESLRARFKNEAAAMANLQHPNIVGLIDFLEEEGALYLVMEYVEGMPLDEYLNSLNEDPPVELAKSFILQILEGMSYAHNSGVVHRDIKPANILITKDNRLKILDFGIAKLVFEDGNSMTKTGTQMGTVFYMSPEQVQGQKVDQRTDIYSLGVTFYQILTRTNPYYGMTTEFEVYGRIVKEPLPLISMVNNDSPTWIDPVIQKATAKSPDDRFSDCAEFISAIKNKREGLPSVIKEAEGVDSDQPIESILTSLREEHHEEPDSEPTNQIKNKNFVQKILNDPKKKKLFIIALILLVILLLSLTYYVNVYEPYHRDTDGDGVRDDDDFCLWESGDADLNGCPDSDNDGITDRNDNCPFDYGSENTNGCPDSDLDGISNEADDCPYTYGNSPDGCFYHKYVNFKNSTVELIHVAVGYYRDGSWQSEGWYNLSAFDSQTYELPYKFEGSEIYLYAESYDIFGNRAWYWGGTDKYLCVKNPGPFDYYGTSCSRKRGFYKISLEGETTEHSFTL